MTDFEARIVFISLYMILPCAVVLSIAYLRDKQDKRIEKASKPKNTFKK